MGRRQWIVAASLLLSSAAHARVEKTNLTGYIAEASFAGQIDDCHTVNLILDVENYANPQGTQQSTALTLYWALGNDCTGTFENVFTTVPASSLKTASQGKLDQISFDQTLTVTTDSDGRQIPVEIHLSWLSDGKGYTNLRASSRFLGPDGAFISTTKTRITDASISGRFVVDGVDYGSKLSGFFGKATVGEKLRVGR